MAGIYIHIPFCRKACHYCNFHFSTSLNLKAPLVQALSHELKLQARYLGQEPIQTIYLGGGTPSLLEESELNALLTTVKDNYEVADQLEVTLEANPDDLTESKLNQLRNNGVNRLSIGVQSFDEEDLLWMNRSHNVTQALASIEGARRAGFKDISIDLIFGCPTTTTEKWKNNLVILEQMDIPHLSCYGLTIEEKTALAHQVKSANGPRPCEESNAEQFKMTMDHLSTVGYVQYEISNYAKGGRISKHNTNYWKQVPYLGIGPSAHSFNGTSRQWNVAHNPKYIQAIERGLIPCEVEKLTLKDQFNEYLMTSMRTMWGCDLNKIKGEYSVFYEEFEVAMNTLIKQQQVQLQGTVLSLTEQGKFLADPIISELFAV